MRLKFKVLLLLAPVILAADQLTKFWVLRNFPYGSRFPVIDGFFDLVHVRNAGAAFGLFSGAAAEWREPFFFVISAGAILFLLYYWRKLRETERLNLTVVGLLLGGVAGNWVDRIRFGNVVDFLSFYIGDYEWPAFNVADSAITISMGLLVLQALRGGGGGKS